MKIIVCFRHLKCICRKWRRGMDYSWHVQHLLREFGRGQFADPRSVAGREGDGEAPPSNMNVTSPTVLDQAYLNLRGEFGRVPLIKSKLPEFVRRFECL